jgi:hypothetical protein
MSAFKIRYWDVTYVEHWPAVASQIREWSFERDKYTPAALARIAGQIVDAVIARGSTVRKDIADLAPLLDDTLSKLAEEAAEQPLSFVNLRLLDCLGALLSMGVAMPPSSLDAAREILLSIETENDVEFPQYQWHRGLIALALDMPKVYRPIAGFDEGSPVGFEPHQRFGPDIQGFIAHLVGAVENRVPISECLTAWTDRLDHYSSSRQEKTFYAPCLFWTAWILHCRISGQPQEEVADWLHTNLYRYAGVETTTG